MDVATNTLASPCPVHSSFTPDQQIGCTYILPLRSDVERRGELDQYLREVSLRCAEVIVVDGSPPEVFAGNARAWRDHVRHMPPDPAPAALNGKAAGVNTGVRHASHELIVIADDDVRYQPAELRRTLDLLQRCDLVRPQNYFRPLPWHARWDTARILLNRGLHADFPGTFGVRRSRLRATGGYDANVLFENLELIRTVEADGGATATPLDLYVQRLPPTARHFWGQRIRQAYDDFAIPARMIAWLAIIPAGIAAARARRTWPVATAAVAVVLIAERGRRRAGGCRVFPLTASLLAPAWALERGICAWLAVIQRVGYRGSRYSHKVIPLAAHSRRYLRKEARARSTASAACSSARET
jgi:Glycosyl transferase family 2